MTDYEYYKLVEEENTHNCSFYPDDCRYCRNCDFTWMQYDYDDTIEEWVKIEESEDEQSSFYYSKIFVRITYEITVDFIP